MDDPVRAQIVQNCETFQQLLPQLLPTSLGLYALMHDGAIVSFFATMQEAYTEGQRLCAATYCFSVHAVTDSPRDG